MVKEGDRNLGTADFILFSLRDFFSFLQDVLFILVIAMFSLLSDLFLTFFKNKTQN